MSRAGSALPILLILAAQTAAASETHYNVKLTVDLDRQQIIGREEIRFTHPRGDFEWQKQAGLRVLRSSGDGSQHLKFEYTATATRGLRWLPDKGGLFTTFYCEDVTRAVEATDGGFDIYGEWSDYGTQRALLEAFVDAAR